VAEVWEAEFSEIGIFSSPRAADLNGDGIKDIIFGAGKDELLSTEYGVIALDGATGDTLWTIASRDQIFGSAGIMDITENGIPDIVIGGRAAVLYAINGRTGELIWEFLPNTSFEEARNLGYYNFFNPQFIPDQDGDGLNDILISNGGDVTISPDNPDRPAGKLMIISSGTGELIAEATVPDGNETYMSVVVSKIHEDDEDYTIIFGTGGETFGGSLYRTTLSDLINEDLSNSIELSSSARKGYIAPPVLIDLNQDGALDIVVNAVEGKIMAISGKDNSVLWEQKIENTEAYGSIAAGHFLDKERIDLFTTFSIGVWPVLLETEQLLINGDTGEVMKRDTLGIFQTATPVVADFNNDGYDEALISVNIGREQISGPISYENMLVLNDFYNNQVYPINQLQPGANVASTPWVGDLNNNGKLDIVYVRMNDPINIFAMKGFRMIRLQSDLETKKQVRWGAYMGSGYSGIYR
tara:strand:- start:21081 stop:22487 length:1407 start_codon:yes stop_codon:yes gene_type:complete